MCVAFFRMNVVIALREKPTCVSTEAAPSSASIHPPACERMPETMGTVDSKVGQHPLVYAFPTLPGKSIHNDTVVNIPTSSSSYPSCGAIRRQHLANIAAGSRWVLKRLLSLTAAAKLFTLGCQFLHPVPKWARNAVPQGSPVPLVTALKTIHTRWVCQFPCHLILRDQWVIDCWGMSSKVEWLIPTEGEGVFARFSPFVTNCTSGPADHVPNGSNISRGLIDALSNLFMPYWHRGNSTRGLDERKNETKVCLGKKKSNAALIESMLDL